MLEKFKSIIGLAMAQHETRLNLAGLGISNMDIVVLKDLLDSYPTITGLNLANNNLTRKAGETFATFKTLKWLSVKQNSLGDDGVRKLLTMPSLEFLDVSENDITSNLEELLAKREQEGVEIRVENNLLLNSDYPVPCDLAQSSVHFRERGPLHTEEKRLSAAEGMAKFGMQRWSSESASDDSEEYLNILQRLDEIQKEDTGKLTHNEIDTIINKLDDLKERLLKNKLLSK